MKPQVTQPEVPVRFSTQIANPGLPSLRNSKNKRSLVHSYEKASTKISRHTQLELSPENLLLQLSLLRPSGQSIDEEFKWNYLFSEAMSKWPHGVDSNSPEVREQLAVEKLLASNARCREINDQGFKKMDDLPAILHLAQNIIVKILCGTNGDVDAKETLFKEFSLCSLPAGASTSHPYTKRALCEKYRTHDEKGRDWTVTPRAEKYFLAQRACLPWLSNFVYSFHLGNEVFTVDKTSVIDRAACKESLINSQLQRAAGTFLRRCLKRAGVDLNDQTRNQQLALLGSMLNNIATIDLSSASDLNSDRLIFTLLPPWLYEILDDLRSHYGLIKGETPDRNKSVKWDLFSTMGNGFTFELESLVFYALAKACAQYTNSKGPVTVYGDDIICPSSCAPLLLEVLEAVGHKPNKSKTFIEGPFRESCGKHYHNGFDVTPFYFRKEIDTLHRVHWFLNRLRMWAGSSYPEITDCDPVVYPLWLHVARKFSLTTYAYEGDIDSIDTLYVPYKYASYRITCGFKTIRYTGYGPLFKFFQLSKEDKFTFCKFGAQELDLGSVDIGQDTDKPIVTVAYAATDCTFNTDFNNYSFPQESHRHRLNSGADG